MGVAQGENLHTKVEVTLTVVDHLGDPVPGANVISGLLKIYEEGSIFRGLTDKDGQFHFSGEHTRGFSARVTKQGYYETETKGTLRSKTSEGEDATSFDPKVVLRPIRNPIAMFARGEQLLVVPKTGVRTGYDLEAGD
jgi:hypothetical protein